MDLLAISKRGFARHRQQNKTRRLQGLFDHRLGARSAQAGPADQNEWIIEIYRTRYLDLYCETF